MQLLKNLFNSNGKYYLELDNLEESPVVQKAVKTTEKVADTIQDKAKEVVESKPIAKTAKAVEKAKDKVVEKEATTSKNPAQSEAKAGKKTSSTAKAKTSSEAAQKPAKVSPKDAGASSFDPPFWVAAMYNNKSNQVNSDGTQAEQTFATDNLMPTITKYRRRPGPSLNKFKDMASKTRAPKG